jgi:hypothetical protein
VTTRKTSAPAATEEETSGAPPAAADFTPAPADPTVCVNCGEPAAFKTKNEGAAPTSYCESCAGQVYPDDQDEYLAPLDA